MENKCEKCGQLPPKYLAKGHGIDAPNHPPTYGKIVAPRASKKPMKSKKK